MDAPNPHQYQVEICDLIWFPQVGLILQSDDGERYAQKGSVHGLMQVLDISGHCTIPTPWILTVYGPMTFRDDVAEWLTEKNWSYEICRTPTKTSPSCRGVVKFTDPSHALVFKLTWGGNV